MKHTRLDQLSDGIFAIVMTILVFQIVPPVFSHSPTNLELWNELKLLLPRFLSYLLSFSLLFTYWRAHHFFVSIYAKNVDMTLANINAVFFLFVGIIPFSTSLLGEYSTNELAVGIFALNTILIGLCLYFMRGYVLNAESIQNIEITKGEIHRGTIRTLVPVFSALFAIPISFISSEISLGLFTFAVLFNFSQASTKFFAKIFK